MSDMLFPVPSAVTGLVINAWTPDLYSTLFMSNTLKNKMSIDELGIGDQCTYDKVSKNLRHHANVCQTLLKYYGRYWVLLKTAKVKNTRNSPKLHRLTFMNEQTG